MIPHLLCIVNYYCDNGVTLSNLGYITFQEGTYFIFLVFSNHFQTAIILVNPKFVKGFLGTRLDDQARHHLAWVIPKAYEYWNSIYRRTLLTMTYTSEHRKTRKAPERDIPTFHQEAYHLLSLPCSTVLHRR